MALIFVDCEAVGPCPKLGNLTEFGAVERKSKQTFHGKIWNTIPSEKNKAIPKIIDLANAPNEVFYLFAEWLAQFGNRHTFISDNPAYDWQWINDGFHVHLENNPFGFSARRIGDLYAGAKGNFYDANDWKKYRKTVHDHNPVNDALGNLEAFDEFCKIYKINV